MLNPCSTWLWPCDRVNIKIQIFQKFLNSSFFGRTNSPRNKSKLSLNLLNLLNFSQDFCTWMMKEGNSNLAASASTEEIYLSLKILSTSCSNVGTENFLFRMWSGDKHNEARTIKLLIGRRSFNLLIAPIIKDIHYFLKRSFLSEGQDVLIATLTAVGNLNWLNGNLVSILFKSIFRRANGVLAPSTVDPSKNIFISFLINSSYASERKGTMGLSVWKGRKKPFNIAAISLKNINFRGTSLSLNTLTDQS